MRAAPIVCPEESPLLFCRNIYIPLVFSPTTARRGLGASGKPPVRPQAHSLPPVGPDAPSAARGEGLQPYGALYCFRWRSEGGAGGNVGKTQGGLPLGNPVCLWQTELFKLNLKSSPSPSGHNRRRRLAPGRSGKQQAERTAVRAAPIVCPEESPPACSNRQQLCRKKFPLSGLDAPTPARIGTCRPKGRSHFSFGGERKVCKRKPAARRLREKGFYCPF